MKLFARSPLNSELAKVCRFCIRRHTLCPKNVVHQIHGDNFVSSRIFKILSLLKREINFQQNAFNTSHHTFSLFPHYFAKISYLTKTKTSYVISLNIFHDSCSKCPPFVFTHVRRRPHHSSVALSMMVWSVPCQTCNDGARSFFLPGHIIATTHSHSETATQHANLAWFFFSNPGFRFPSLPPIQHASL